MTDTIGFALVGCGRIAQKYSEIFASDSLPGAKLVTACDIQPDRVARLGERHNIPYYTDMHKMMEAHQGEIDVVCILTESGLHADHTCQMAAYGKHIIVEKPMALTVEDADRMILECEKAGIKLFVVKQNRYNYPVVKLREAFEAQRFGKMVMGTVRVRWSRNQAYYDQDPWRGTWAMDGGVFSNQASHHVDLLTWFLGRPIKVFAKTRRALVDIEAEDTGVAVITFESGAIGVVEATTATRPKDLEGSLSLMGESGTVEIGGFAVNQMKIWNFLTEAAGDKEVLDTYRENPPNVYGFGHVAYLNHVLDCLRNGSPSLVDGQEGRKSLELIEAIYASADSGQEITFGRPRPESPLGGGIRRRGTDKIPLVDLKTQYLKQKNAFDTALSQTLERTSFIGGPDHKAFAENFAAWCGGGAVALVGNGTDAIELAITELLGQGNGDEEIITVSNTFIATTEAITRSGYRPKFVDVNPETLLMDVSAVKKAINPNTRAIIPVHLFGQMVDMPSLKKIADAHDLKIIEDAAQAHGATYSGAQPGIIGDAATFSFYPGKNLGAWGDGGAVFSKNAELIERINRRANHGRSEKYLHEFEGRNSRLDGLQAAVLNVKLSFMDEWNDKRRAVAERYRQLLADQPSIKIISTAQQATPVYHLFVIQINDRDRVLADLQAQGIGAGVHYPVPLHLQPAYRHLGVEPGQLPVTEEAAHRILSLPIFPEITDEQIVRVTTTLTGLIKA